MKDIISVFLAERWLFFEDMTKNDQVMCMPETVVYFYICFVEHFIDIYGLLLNFLTVHASISIKFTFYN